MNDPWVIYSEGVEVTYQPPHVVERLVECMSAQDANHWLDEGWVLCGIVPRDRFRVTYVMGRPRPIPVLRTQRPAPG